MILPLGLFFEVSVIALAINISLNYIMVFDSQSLMVDEYVQDIYKDWAYCIRVSSESFKHPISVL